MTTRVTCHHCSVWIIWLAALDRWVRGSNDDPVCQGADDGRHRIAVA